MNDIVKIKCDNSDTPEICRLIKIEDFPKVGDVINGYVLEGLEEIQVGTGVRCYFRFYNPWEVNDYDAISFFKAMWKSETTGETLFTYFGVDSMEAYLICETIDGNPVTDGFISQSWVIPTEKELCDIYQQELEHLKPWENEINPDSVTILVLDANDKPVARYPDPNRAGSSTQ